MTSNFKLFQPVQVGDLNLSNRIVLAPVTRFRATNEHVPGPLAAEYYAQRASTPGTLLITEGTFPSAQAGGYPNVPGIWSDEHIRAWKKVTDAVHAKGSFIFMQMWVLGRAATPGQLEKEGFRDAYIAPSPIPLSKAEHKQVPRELTISEIHDYYELYSTAAKKAVEAGFDGVELHGARGYLIDQFTQDVCNQRTDDYGGSVENRTKFARNAVSAVAKAIGAKKTGLRVSPWGTFQDMRMKDPVPTYSHLFSTILTDHPELAYVHVVESGADVSSSRTTPIPHENNDFIRDIVRDQGRGTKIISAGAYTRETAIDVAEKKDDLIAFGRLFLANPDLPTRLKNNVPLNVGNRKTYCIYGSTTPLGYTDYPFYQEQEQPTVDLRKD